MDTDDLSIPTYEGIIIEAERFNHDLTLRFGMLASHCENDDDYLDQAEKMIKKWRPDEGLEFYAESIFFDERVYLKAFRKTLDKLLSNIAEIRKTPMAEREYEEW